ncbi:unnamed protein product [Pleuronectes platessa]|uniref:Uncharacterized protein n=1 Tax=Pleuronectes platessa TaxID=8262 RepID=A0A9N7U6Q0_PLEPL|nr:unnamed protein product [Pleuronectes platessa]
MEEVLMANNEQDKNNITAAQTAALARPTTLLNGEVITDPSQFARMSWKQPRREQWLWWQCWMKRGNLQEVPSKLTMCRSSWKIKL